MLISTFGQPLSLSEAQRFRYKDGEEGGNSIPREFRAIAFYVQGRKLKVEGLECGAYGSRGIV